MTAHGVLLNRDVATHANGEPLRLNLGGAGEGFVEGRIPGFLTLDLRQGPDTDIVGDASDLSQFGDQTVSEIYASQILEHFSHLKTVEVLKEWNRVLRPGGRLYVSVPDFDEAVRIYQKVGLVHWLVFHLWGDQKHSLNYHYTCFTFGSLARALIEAGFSDARRVERFPFSVNDGSTHLNTATERPISLSVEAVK